jgi:protein-S-isoprenylcysteine O-methyltransferase Ste14
MDLVLRALGRPIDTENRLWLAVIIAGATGLITVAPHAVVALGVPPAAVHAAIAIAWLHWLGWSFPVHWARDVQRVGHEQAYRAAFFRDIVPGVCGNFAQIARPMCYGALGFAIAPPPQLAFGLALAAMGGALVALGLRTIGIAGAMFVYEYGTPAPVLTTRGVYGWLRHPLYIGGVVMSLGLALMFDDPTAWGLAAINVAAVPPFLIAENRRCERVFGERYRRYKHAVPALGLRGSYGQAEASNRVPPG